jgi:hypothetical protein
MNEPKRRGRPPKAKLLQPSEPNAKVEGADAPKCPECGWVVGHYDDCPVGMGVDHPTYVDVDGVVHQSSTMLGIKREIEAALLDGLHQQAQAYALRVWNGQNRDLPRSERLDRVRRALEGQNLPFEGVVL